MAIKLAVSTRNARLNAIETDIGANPVLKIWPGTVPADCAAADAAGPVIASVTMADWLDPATGGTISKSSAAWQDLSADNAGTATHFRIYTTGGSVCKMQGTCGLSGASPDMVLDNATLTAGQAFTVTAFVLTDANA